MNPGNSSLVNIESALVVDDSLVQRNHAVNLCTQLGIKMIHQAADGAQALELLRTLNPLPTVLLIDLEMPGMDGVELVQQLYADDFHIALIIASGRDPAMIQSVEKMIEALGLPLIGSLKKPIRIEPLQDLLYRLSVRRSAGRFKA